MDFVERFRYIGYHMIWLFSNCENMELMGKQLILLTIAYRVSNTERVKLGHTFSSWQSIFKGVPQGSWLGALWFNIFKNDLHCAIKHTALSTYADDTQIFYAGDVVNMEVEAAINTDFGRIYGQMVQGKWNETKSPEIQGNGIKKINREFCV